ncbi:MAG TPA: ATP-binding cassette domain-containing protein [Lapillicoccus sp.]|nr:ATP-binding cassette domain-containing protein [Lapillicoccus sp.]
MSEPTADGGNPYARPTSDAPLEGTETAGALEPTSTGKPEPEATEGSVVVRGVAVRYGSLVAVDDVDLVVPPGTLLALTGPSGAGKSSLLWAIAGAVRPAVGEVTVGETRIADRGAAIRAGVALIPQGNGLAGVLTAHENVAFPLLATGTRPDEVATRAATALADVGLSESGDHLVEELSGGQQQRVAVARGLATEAPVLLADEPTSELDHTNRGRVLELLRAQADRGAVVVMATHDPEAAAVCDGEVRLDEGRLSRLR